MIVTAEESMEALLRKATNDPSAAIYLSETKADISSINLCPHALSLDWSSGSGCAYFRLTVTNLDFTTYATHVFPPLRDLCIIQPKKSRTRVLHHPARNKYFEHVLIMPTYLTLSSKSSKSVSRAASVTFNC